MAQSREPAWGAVWDAIEANPDGMTLEEIGATFDPPLCREAIRVIEQSALRSLRQALGAEEKARSAASAKPSRAAQVLKALRWGPKSSKELRLQLGLNTDQVAWATRDLVRTGQAVRVSHGVFLLPEADAC